MRSRCPTLDASKSSDVEAQNLAFFKRESAGQASSLVAVSDEFLCYALVKGAQRARAARVCQRPRSTSDACARQVGWSV